MQIWSKNGRSIVNGKGKHCILSNHRSFYCASVLIFTHGLSKNGGEYSSVFREYLNFTEDIFKELRFFLKLSLMNTVRKAELFLAFMASLIFDRNTQVELGECIPFFHIQQHAQALQSVEKSWRWKLPVAVKSIEGY